MSFFKHFSQRWHQLPDGDRVLLCNITRRVTIDAAAKENQTILLKHRIAGNETPMVLSYRLYGTTDYWWTVLLVNDIHDPVEGWPLNERELEEYIIAKYGDARYKVHHWVDVDGNVTDPRAVKIFNGFSSEREAAQAMSLEPITNDEYEVMANDAKREINLIDPIYIDTFGRELERVMNNEQ